MSLAILARLFCWGTILISSRCRKLLCVDAIVAVALTVHYPSFATIRLLLGDNAREKGHVVIDEAGRSVKMPAEVDRIVTLAPNLTEIVYDLGLENKLVGDTTECDTPPDAKSKPHVGNPQSPSVEAIVALHPDLVLATTAGNPAQTADELNRLGIATYTSEGETRTVLGILDSIARMADLMGAKAQGEEMVTHLRARLDALHARLSERPMVHVLFVVWEDPLITIGQKTFIADALRWAGAESIVLSKQSWPRLSIEEVIRLQPDYIVFSGNHGATSEDELADLRSRTAWRDLNAVELGHVVNIGAEALRPSPGLLDAIEQLARDVHPEAFEKSELRGPSGKSSAADTDARMVAACVR
jgi:iron complex transport system substrate-binding protein